MGFGKRLAWVNPPLSESSTCGSRETASEARTSAGLHHRPCSTRSRLCRQDLAHGLLDQFLDWIMNHSDPDEVDGMQAIELVAVTLAGPRNQTIVVGANPPSPIANRQSRSHTARNA